jgi:soluble lytic murein transglycosylase-like protein
MAFDQYLADLRNKLALQYPDASDADLEQLAGISAAESGNYAVDTIATPGLNTNYGQLTSVPATQATWVTPALLDSLAYVESRNNPLAVSPAGARGVYQIMPDTAAQPGYGVTPLTPQEVLDPVKAREFARQYLEGLQKAYPNYTPAEILQAYNAGPGRMAKYKNGIGPALAVETQLYAGKV